MPSKRKKIKDSIIPPLDFVGSLPSEKIPINDEYIPCTANYPRVRTIASENQPPWIRPHFDYSGFVKQPSQSVRAFKDDIPPPRKRKSKSIIGPLNFSSDGTPTKVKSFRTFKTQGNCPLFPLVTPDPIRRDAKILVPESPER
ncbi:unnamed protein product [Rodentolepis nana]|uniref:Uncharacterized protein n=1 Tax=Rodentolepis nana TaxID=102285 RepID=A0A0R3T1P7_RODNA|nr:unnamed protein product [Rodentolepis nana]